MLAARPELLQRESTAAKFKTALAVGIGVPQDYIIAHKWFSLAIANEEGDSISKSVRLAEMTQGNLANKDTNNTYQSLQLRDKLAVNMTPAQVAKAQELTRNWQPKKNTCVESD
jgi:hypothetical protein